MGGGGIYGVVFCFFRQGGEYFAVYARLTAAPVWFMVVAGGELGGDAIVDVLFGSHNPDGKLPTTIYPKGKPSGNTYTIQHALA